jgi:hypothetical protein
VASKERPVDLHGAKGYADTRGGVRKGISECQKTAASRNSGSNRSSDSDSFRSPSQPQQQQALRRFARNGKRVAFADRGAAVGVALRWPQRRSLVQQRKAANSAFLLTRMRQPSQWKAPRSCMTAIASRGSRSSRDNATALLGRGLAPFSQPCRER